MIYGWLRCEAQDMFSDECLISITTISGKLHAIVDKTLIKYEIDGPKLKVVVLPDSEFVSHKDDNDYKRIVLPVRPIEHKSGQEAVVRVANLRA